MSELRTLGSTGLSVPALIAGGNVFGWTADEATSFAILDAWVDAGIATIDTADVYSAFVPGNVGGESETILGKWMKARGNRSSIQISTKMGLLPVSGGRKGLAPDIIAEAIELSLQRLQTDYVDLYFAHWDDETVPQDAVAEGFDRLIKAGKVRAIGASNFSQPRLASALDAAKEAGLASYGALQPEFNLMAVPSFPADYRQFCIDNDIGTLTYFALASGFLTGKYRAAADVQGSARERLLGGYFNARGDRVLAALDRIAADTGATLPQIALAWQIATPGVTAPIASASSVAQVASLIPALELKLDAEQLAALDAAAATPV